MSRDLLQGMYDLHVFDAMLLDTDMSEYHVPFDQLTGDPRTEQALREAVSRYERVALAGVSGAGKTSVARFALEPPPARIAPIFVPVAYKDADVATDPKRFAQYLVDVISDAAQAAERIPPRQREQILAGSTDSIELATIARHGGIGLTVKAWILQGSIARDVTRTLAGGSFRRSEQEILERANDVLQAIAAHGLKPVLIMDDADRLVGRANPDTTIPAFFGGVLRAVVDKLEAGIVVAAQPFYLERHDYRQHTAGLIEKHITIPEIPDVSGLAAILTARVKYAARDRAASDAFDDEALGDLFTVYRAATERSVRRALAAAHGALSRAQADLAEKITGEHVRAGADDTLLS